LSRRKQRLWLLPVLVGLAILVTIASKAQDQSALRPPKGASVAIIVFEDLQCPDCARAAPLVEEAGKTYKIPVVRHDFPLPQHNWSSGAAIMARWFDSKSAKIGNEFRAAVFANQESITTPEQFRAFAEKFATEKKMSIPFAIDPQGKLAAAVEADKALGTRIGIQHTPTIYVVSNTRTGTPFVEVVDRTQLYSLIDEMKAGASQTASR
jgi:protein-disulfide isomerase